MSTAVRADLIFSVEVPRPGHGATDAPDRIEGRVIGSGHVITVAFSQTPSLTAPAARNLARGVAHRLDDLGLTIRLAGPEETVIAELGHLVRSPWWQRPLTRSRLIRVVSVRGGLRSLSGPKLFVAALPDIVGPGRT